MLMAPQTLWSFAQETFHDGACIPAHPYTRG